MRTRRKHAECFSYIGHYLRKAESVEFWETATFLELSLLQQEIGLSMSVRKFD